MVEREISITERGAHHDHDGHRGHPCDQQAPIGCGPEHRGDDRGGERTHRKHRRALAIERPNLFGLHGGIGRGRRFVRHCRHPTSR